MKQAAPFGTWKSPVTASIVAASALRLGGVAARVPGRPKTDPTLQDPQTVFQILKRHYARYTPEMVENVCGCPKEKFIQVAETLLANSGRDLTSAIVVAIAAVGLRAMEIPRLLGPALLVLVFFLWDAVHGTPPSRRRDARRIWETVLLLILGAVVIAWSVRLRG